MTRYQAALRLIRAMDQHRLLAQAGKSTFTDALNVKSASYWYRRASRE